MGSSGLIEIFDELAFYSHNSWSTFLDNIHMNDPAAAASAEEASLPSPAVTCTIIMLDRRVPVKTKEGKYCRGAEGACRLFAMVEAVTVIELERC